MDTCGVLLWGAKQNKEEKDAVSQGVCATQLFTTGEGRAREPVSCGPLSLLVGNAVTHDILFNVDWKARATALQAAVVAADANRVNSHRAKRLLRELHAYVGAASATRHLKVVMARTPCGTTSLRGALTHLEEAAAALSSTAHPMLPPDPSLLPSQMTQVRLLRAPEMLQTLCYCIAAASALFQAAPLYWRALSSCTACANPSTIISNGPVAMVFSGQP
jgi:hypothetical protein